MNTGSDLMASIEIPVDWLKIVAQLLYSAGPIQFEVPEINMIVNGVLSTLGLPKGSAEVKLSEEPTVSISPRGVSVRANVRVQSLVPPVRPALPVTCKVTLKLDFKGARLVLVSRSSRCRIKPVTVTGKMMKPVVNHFLNRKIEDLIDSRFDGGLQIPLPEGVDFTRSKIDYYDGRLVLQGSPTLTPVLVQMWLKRLKKAKINRWLKS